MAYLDETALNTLQDNTFLQTELRTLKHGLINLAKNLDSGAGWLTPEMRANLQTNVGRSFELPALKEEVITVLDEESFDIPINASTSETVTATKISMYSGFRMYESTFTNQLMSADQYKQNKYMEIFKAFAKKKEEYIQTFLESKKTQVFNVDGNPGSYYTFNTTADQLEIAIDGQQDIMLETLATLMSQNNLNGAYAMAGSYGLKHAMDYYIKYGQANQLNLQNQMLPMAMDFSNQITNTEQFTAYLGLVGAMAMVENYKPDFVNGTSLANATFGITTAPVPFLNERIQMFQNKDLADASGISTSTSEYKMTTYQEESFLSTFYLIEKYNSDRANRVGDIIRIEGQTS